MLCDPSCEPHPQPCPGLGPRSGTDAFYVAILDVIEVDADERAVARIVFDLDDFDAAIAELDARYLAGEAAAYARRGWLSQAPTLHWASTNYRLPQRISRTLTTAGGQNSRPVS